jgi:hypothetical protein
MYAKTHRFKHASIAEIRAALVCLVPISVFSSLGARLVRGSIDVQIRYNQIIYVSGAEIEDEIYAADALFLPWQQMHNGRVRDCIPHVIRMHNNLNGIPLLRILLSAVCLQGTTFENHFVAMRDAPEMYSAWVKSKSKMFRTKDPRGTKA